jgi:hypothetical protein
MEVGMTKSKKPKPREWVGWREAAAKYGFTPWAMYKAYSTGEAPAFVFAGKMYCLRPELEKWFQSLAEKRISA